jgi:hypothetical protein
MCSAEEGRRMAAAIPNAVFVPLEGPNHVLLDGEPAQARFFKELQDFMRDCAVEYTKSHLEMAVVPRIADMIGGPDRLANTKPTNVRNWDKASTLRSSAKQRKPPSTRLPTHRYRRRDGTAAVTSEAESQRSSALGHLLPSQRCDTIECCSD